MAYKLYVTGALFYILSVPAAKGQELSAKHNPKRDFNLSPRINPVINPVTNSSINPKLNWNINPYHTARLNPQHNNTINPISNQNYNPNYNVILNPMYQNSLHPKNPIWTGLYMYDSTDSLIGYVSVATQDVMLSFDLNAEWTGYFIRASPNLFNYFDLKGACAGSFLCYDSKGGYNVFTKDGNFTGKHIK